VTFPTPIVFFRRPDFGTPQGGPAEIAPLMQQAGVKAVAIDPLIGGWDGFLQATRARFRVYGWTRVYTSVHYQLLRTQAAQLGLEGTFPNIEDDDLREAGGDRVAFLYDIRHGHESLGQPPPVGVPTNYFVSGEWPVDNALSDLPVLPEWFPREITDPAATLAGSLASGREHFAAAVPLLDGREPGLARFGVEQDEPFGVFAGDDVQDWSEW
jgi:hypothetical protein